MGFGLLKQPNVIPMGFAKQKNCMEYFNRNSLD